MAHEAEVKLQVAETGQRTRRGWKRVALGKEIAIDYEAIQKTFPQPLGDGDCDLLTVVAAVLFADRSVQRTLTDGWGRALRLLVPVFDLDVWDSPAVSSALRECLRYVSGDRWEFEFCRRRRRPSIQQGLLADPTLFDGVAAAVPYSGGLDSLAGLEVLRAGKAETAILLVGSESNRDVGHVIRRTASAWDHGTEQVSVKISLHPHGRPETTYRTRTFGYFSTAALASRLVGGSEVVVMENGQGALGPSLLPQHREFPYRASHPGFTRRLQAFLSALWGEERVLFRHPHVWQTKAEMLAKAATSGDPERWANSVSCSYNMPRQRGRGSAPLCGICGGCILRSVALWAAGFAHLEDRSKFVFQDMSAPSLAAGMGGQVTSSESELALASVMNMNHLARLSEEGRNAPAIQRVADELSISTGVDFDNSTDRLIRLVSAHAQEWWGFVEQFGPGSWIAQVGGHRG